jgi:hypothetical protein
MSYGFGYLDNEQHITIAEVAIKSAELDNVIELVVYELLYEQQKTSEFILKNMAPDRLVGLIESILLDRYPNEEVETIELIAKIRRARLERNEIMHSLTDERTEDPLKIGFVRKRPYREETRVEKSAAEIHALGIRLRECSDSLYEHSRRAWLSRPASLDTPG